MPGHKRLPAELLFDSEASLRLADTLLAELTGSGAAVTPPRLGQELLGGEGAGRVPDAASLIDYAGAELDAIVEALHRGRSAVEVQDASDAIPAERRLELAVGVMRDVESWLAGIAALLLSRSEKASS